MTFIKLGELTTVSADNLQTQESVLSDVAINNRFKKLAGELKRIAPKADDFLYFSAIFMNSAERSLINDDGSARKRADGTLVEAHWEVLKNGGLKWVCNDENILPFKNANGDIFPESELLKSYKDFIGKPLCVDHRSSSIDAVRGVIIDAYYDRPMKRIVGLCALDKITYPDLARKIVTGYSTCVSIGVGVSVASCTSCGNAARTENEFCDHMRRKNCYGEINIGINPIELSIVVNGADRLAKIRTVLAAANSLNNRLSETQNTFQTLTKQEQSDKLDELSQTLTNASEELQKLKIESAEVPETITEAQPELQTEPKEVEPPYGQSSGKLNSPTDETDPNGNILNIPERYAHNQTLLGELNNLRLSIEAKLSNLEKLLTTKEENMSEINKEGYYQGGGGVNEPTPGKPKYTKDPLNEKLREDGDKQMVGQKPFPDVGKVDGLHPSPESAEVKDELERKKLLSRAERRAAALQSAKESLATRKEAYYQGGGGVNEPAPHKVKYTKDPLNEQLRAHEDKQMVGQKPFPDVGKVDGLHPSPESAETKDELERKKLLQRASYKAKFQRVANVDGTDNLGASGWQVFAKDDSGEKLIFTASVDEISGGRSEALFDVIATEDFARKMLDKIRTAGIEKAASMYKKAQAVAEPGGAVGGPQDMGGAGAVPAMPAAPALDAAPAPDMSDEKDDGGKGDPKETLMHLAEKNRDVASDLLEAARKLTGEQAEMGDMEQDLTAMPKAASETIRPLTKMRRQLNSALISGIKKSVAELNDSREELEVIANILDNGNVKEEYVSSAIEDAFVDAKKTITDAETLKQAYYQYVNGTEGLMKQAEEASEKSTSEDKEENMANDGDMNDHMDLGEPGDLDLDGDEDLDMDLGLDEEDHDHDHDAEGHRFDDEDALEEPVSGDVNDTVVDIPAGSPIPPNAKAVNQHPGMGVAQVATASFDLTTKAGRSAYRAKLARDATGKQDNGELVSAEKIQFSDMLDQANSLADGQTKLDTKPSGDLGCVETKPERNKQMLDVAKAPPKVRKEAERLNQLISEGRVNPTELDSLVAQGLDGEVVKYWRQFYGEMGSEGSAFAKLLTTENMKAKQAEEMTSYKVKVARAYELVNDMVRRGLCADDRLAVSAQVEQVMGWNDEAFDSMKRIIAKQQPNMQKQASLPYVGILENDLEPKGQSLSLQAELDAAFSTKRRGF